MFSDLEDNCLLQNWNNKSTEETLQENHCPAVWDGVNCWPPTPPGNSLEIPCLEIFNVTYLEYADNITGNAYRECLLNGTWANGTETNYDECAESLRKNLRESDEDDHLFPAVNYIIFCGSILSIVFLTIALIILGCYRCLQSGKFTVRKHLMFSLVVRFLLMLIVTEPHVIGNSWSYRAVEGLCITVLVLFLYSTFASVSWMLVQGFHLNLSLMAGRFDWIKRHELKIYYIFGWVAPAVFVGIFVITMLLKDQKSCWYGYSNMMEMWILRVPVMVEIVVSGVILVNIVRILLQKIDNSRCRVKPSKFKAAAKAIAWLFPVLGINNLILLYSPGGDYYEYFLLPNAFLGSTQGIFVAFALCFMDVDVRGAIRRSRDRAEARRMSDIPNDSNMGSSLALAFRTFDINQNPASTAQNRRREAESKV